jgi:Fic family protein
LKSRVEVIIVSGPNEKYSPPFTLCSKTNCLVADISILVGQIIITEDLLDILRLRRLNRIKTIQSSLAIENNTLTIEQVTAVLNGKVVFAPPNEIREVMNAGRAYELMPSLDPYSIGDLLKAHAAMLEGLKEDAGCFRSGQVGVFAGDQVIHMAPPVQFVWPNMENLFGWLKETDYHPLICSSLFHYELEFIHPFSDGNGRMGRYWQTLLLSHWQSVFAWLPVETVIKKRQNEYYEVLRESQNGASCTPFVVFMLTAILESLQEHYQSVQESVRVSVQDNQNVGKLLAALGSRTLSASELMQRVGQKSRDGFRRNWLKPALELGVIEQTIPDKPNSKNQKYRKKVRP